jgi:hypothetical protein
MLLRGDTRNLKPENRNPKPETRNPKQGALKCFSEAVALRPDVATHWANRSAALYETGKPQKALCGGIPGAFLEPLGRSWSHFVGIYRQKLTRVS